MAPFRLKTEYSKMNVLETAATLLQHLFIRLAKHFMGLKMKSFLFIKILNNACYGAKERGCVYLSMRFKHYDIAIAGGGLVGTAMACSLAKNSRLSGKSIIMFEAFTKKQLNKKAVTDEYSNRVISVNPGTRKFFESLDVWKNISEVRYKAVKRMQVWDACSDALIVFNEDLQNDVSYIIENDVVLYAFERALQEGASNNVTTEYETNIKNVSFLNDKKIKLETDKGKEITCSLLIGADGAKSRIRTIMGKQYLNWNYDQMGIVATLKLTEPTNNIVAWQRFLPTGPIALLPLTDELSSLVWSTTTTDAKELLNLSDESFVDAVNDAFWKEYDKNDFVQSASDFTKKVLDFFTLDSGTARQLPPSVINIVPKSRAAFPLGFGHATDYVVPGVALIGDAAHRVHPLAGQGVNLGFGDVKCLTEVLSEGVYSGSHLSSLSILKRYQKERQKYNFPTMIAIDSLQKLYRTTFTPIVALRTVGLQITNALPLVKSGIMKYASS